MPRLWPRERADDFDVPVQAVAENGGNVLKETGSWCSKHQVFHKPTTKYKSCWESKEAKKVALLDKIMPRIKSVGHVCPMLEFRQECIVCDVVSEYDAIEKERKP